MAALNILVVDDSVTIQKYMAGLLSQFGNVLTAANGNEGLLTWRDAHLHGKPFDIIFLDVAMPRVDGLMMFTQLRQEEEWHHFSPCRVIFVTGLEDMESLIKTQYCLDDKTWCLMKPITFEQVRNEICKFKCPKHKVSQNESS